MNGSMVCACGLIGVMLAGQGQALAFDVDSTNRQAAVLPTLPAISVTASRTPRRILEDPRTAYRIAAPGQTQGRCPRTTPDALKGIPSVMVQKTSYGQGSPYLRGFTGFRTLGLVDGIRLNNSVFRDGPNQYWNTVDPMSLEACDLVLGPGSVLYGSDAIGGMLNALTVTPPAGVDGQPAEWERHLLYRGSTAERSNTGRAEAGGPLGSGASFIGGVSAKTFGDLEGGEKVGIQKHTGYDELDFDGRVDMRPGDDQRLTLAHQTVSQDDAWRTHRTIYGVDWRGLKHGDDKVHAFDQHRDLTYLRYGIDELDGVVDGANVTLSRQDQQEDLVRVRADDTGDEQGFDVETWGGSVQLQSASPIGDWVYGGDYYHDIVDSYARRLKADGSIGKVEIQGPVADDATYDLVGVFVEDTVRLLDGGVDLIPGARYTHAGTDADRVKDPVTGSATTLNDDWDASTLSLRALVPLTDDRDHVLFTSLAQGFRAPNLSDLTRLDTARSNEIETPSPGLDPEEYWSFEVGAKSRLARLESQISYYYTWIDGMIVRAPTGQTMDGLIEVTKQNAGDGFVQGVEWIERCLLTDAWSAWVAATWMEGEAEAYPTSKSVLERDNLSRVMPPTVQIGMRLDVASGRGWVEALVDAADQADALSAEDKRDTQRIPPGGTPGYAVWSLRGGARVMDGLDLTLAMENVLDADYRIHGSGVNEPGRNVIVTADYRF